MGFLHISICEINYSRAHGNFNRKKKPKNHAPEKGTDREKGT